jgi:hypothetical protein
VEYHAYIEHGEAENREQYAPDLRQPSPLAPQHNGKIPKRNRSPCDKDYQRQQPKSDDPDIHARGNPIEILFGALAMQQWGIRLNPADEKLDLSNYPKEFVEF